MTQKSEFTPGTLVQLGSRFHQHKAGAIGIIVKPCTGYYKPAVRVCFFTQQRPLRLDGVPVFADCLIVLSPYIGK